MTSCGISEENAWRRRSRGVGTRAGASCSSAAGGMLRPGCGRARPAAEEARSVAAVSPCAESEPCSFGASSPGRSSPASVLRNSAASGPSRMLARLAFATVEHLLRQLPVGLSRDAVGLVLEHGHPLHRRLGKADRLADPRGEHPIAEVFLEDLDRLL